MSFDARIAAIAAIAGCLALESAFGQDSLTNAERARPSVVELYVSGQDRDNKFKPPSPGSGFVAHTDKSLKLTFLFTAAHVIGAPSEWLQDNNGKVLGRTIRVRRQEDNGAIKIVTDSVNVIAEDHERDVAVLAIPEEPFKTLLIASSTHLRQTDLATLMGFPSADARFIAKILHVKLLDFTNFRIELDGPADAGQSGGPVVDGKGRVVAIASANDNRQNPRFHRAAIATVAVDMLNRYLAQLSLPALVLSADGSTASHPAAGGQPTPLQPAVTKLLVTERTARVTVQVKGTGGGELAQGLKAQQTLAGKSDARVEGAGAEASQCNESSGRTRSEARAVASVQPFELTGLKMRFDLWAQGGHFRTAVTCVAGQPVGLSGNDTAASSLAEVFGEIAFQAAAVPFDLRVVWQDMPAESGIELIGPDGMVHSAISSNGAAERIAKISAAGNWRTKVAARAEARATGGFGRAQIATQPLVFVEAR
jgi:S1-C subfamily serine protease